MKILIAEDNNFFRLALRSILREWGYEVVEAKDGAAAWEILQTDEAPKIAILDWMMPKMDGLEICAKVRSLRRPEPTYLIILTCLDGKENIVNALNAGADDFVHKPFEHEQLRARLNVGQRIVGLQTSQTVVFTLAQAVEAKSPYTQGHADRVTHYALALATQLGLSKTERETLRRGSLLHDIGKISIPDSILNKPGPLNDTEFEEIKRHPILGVEIVKPLHSLADTFPLIRSHHERLDGKGYPDGLQGDEIPYLVRILSVADVYDALSSDRPYRLPIPHERSLSILREDAENGGLDIELVKTFLNLPSETFQQVTEKARYSEYRLSHHDILIHDYA